MAIKKIRMKEKTASGYEVIHPETTTDMVIDPETGETLDNLLIESIPTSEKGASGGVATLGADRKVDQSQLNRSKYPTHVEGISSLNLDINDMQVSGDYIVILASNTLYCYKFINESMVLQWQGAVGTFGAQYLIIIGLYAFVFDPSFGANGAIRRFALSNGSGGVYHSISANRGVNALGSDSAGNLYYSENGNSTSYGQRIVKLGIGFNFISEIMLKDMTGSGTAQAYSISRGEEGLYGVAGGNFVFKINPNGTVAYALRDTTINDLGTCRVCVLGSALVFVTVSDRQSISRIYSVTTGTYLRHFGMDFGIANIIKVASAQPYIVGVGYSTYNMIGSAGVIGFTVNASGGYTELFSLSSPVANKFIGLLTSPTDRPKIVISDVKSMKELKYSVV